MASLNESVIEAGHSIVLVSTSANANCHAAPKSYIFISKVGESQSKFNGALLTINNFAAQSDFTDRIGYVYGFRLEPGDYKASVRAPGWFPGKPDDPTGSRPGKPLEAKLTIRPGEARYLGDIEVAGCNPITLRTRDKWTGFKSRLMNFDTKRVTTTLLTFGAGD